MDQELSTIVTWILLLSNALVMGQEFTPRSYCTPEDSCWPTTDDFDELQSLNPSMEVITRGDGGWAEASNLVLNRRISETPGAVVYVRNSSHVQAVVKFSQDYNLNLKIISSGHEFIGRNIAPGCLLLSVAYMDEISTDLSCPEHSSGCMNVEPGVWWLQAYKAADKVNRIVMGGAEPSVSVTGWMLGGGHSPVSPKLGLGVDQVLMLQMVLADLSLVTLTKDGTYKQHINGTITTSDDTDLFWAARGGGGGTFGVVTLIKYKLHLPPSKHTLYICSFSTVTQPGKSLKEIRNGMNSVMQDLPEEFGGYLLTGTTCYTTFPSCKMAAYALYVFHHWGAVEENQRWFDKLEAESDKLSEYLLSGPCSLTEYSTFYEYVKTLPNITYQEVDMDGTFLTSSEYNEDFIKKESNLNAASFRAQSPMSATYIRLGGQTRNTSSGATAVNPLFRNAMWTIAYGGNARQVKRYGAIIKSTVAAKGQYFSECDDTLDPGEWQEEFWGQSNYDRLLDIKRKYDPDNDFTCKQCVGSNATRYKISLYLLLLIFLLY